MASTLTDPASSVSDVELISSALEVSYPAQVQNCTACTNEGTYVDLNGGSVLKFLNVNGGTGGSATLRFSLSAPSGTRKMGVFVNNTKVGTVSNTTVRPTFAEVSVTASLAAGTGNTVELRDTEGATEPDVAYLKVVTGGAGPVCGNSACESGETCSSCATDCGACNSNVTVTASASLGGLISPSGAVQVSQGGSKTFTFTPDPDMRVKRVCAPTASTCFAYSSNSWTLTNAANGQRVSVEFEYTPGAACGDGICNNMETADNCSTDCWAPGILGDVAFPTAWSNATLKYDSRASYGQYIDGNEGAKMSFVYSAPANVWAKLKFSVQSPSGLRKMGVFVNNVKAGVIASSAPYWNWETVSVNAKLVKGNNTVELRDTEGTTELDVQYFDWTNTVLATSDGAFNIGYSRENGKDIYTELVEFDQGSYLSPQDAGAWWIIDIHEIGLPDHAKVMPSIVAQGLFARNCTTGEWQNVAGTQLATSESYIWETGGSFHVNYFPSRAIFQSTTEVLDTRFMCPGTGPSAPSTTQVTYAGRPRQVLAVGYGHLMAVVKHY